jgi:serine/threonine-protein kinase
MKGKLSYMAPEQVRRLPVDRRADVYAAAVVLWQGLAGRRLFMAPDEAGILHAVLEETVPPPSAHNAKVSSELDAVVLRALSRDPALRHATALELASALESVARPAAPREVGAWVEALASRTIEERRQRLTQIEQTPIDTEPDEGAHAVPSLDKIQKIADVSTDVLLAPASSPAPAATKRGSQRLAFSLLAVLGLVIVGSALVFARGRGEPQATTTAALPSPTDVQAPAASVAGVASTTTAAPAAPAAQVDGGTESPASSMTTTSKPSRRKPPPAATTRSCDPPYSIDSANVKHFKPWCI